jgi:hypothetical protein
MGAALRRGTFNKAVSFQAEQSRTGVPACPLLADRSLLEANNDPLPRRRGLRVGLSLSGRGTFFLIFNTVPS